jgi:hypothetical protein
MRPRPVRDEYQSTSFFHHGDTEGTEQKTKAMKNMMKSRSQGD